MKILSSTTPLQFVSALALAFSFLPSAVADVRMPNIFGDHMVLQRDQKIAIWGWAEPGEGIKVTLGDKNGQATADADGKWRVNLDPVAGADETRELVISGKNELRFKDVVVGDVWICSGQSNMEFGLGNIGAMEELDPFIRVFHVTKSAALTPLDNTTVVPPELGLDLLSGHWQKTLRTGSWNGFSAVGYFFGKDIRQATRKPVGLIGSYWGGTPAQAWTSLEGLKKVPELASLVTGFENLPDKVKSRMPIVWADHVRNMKKWNEEVFEGEGFGKKLGEWKVEEEKARAAGQPAPPRPTPSRPQPTGPGNVGYTSTLFNGMINPLIPFTIKGVIWYQGESNAHQADQYRVLFPTMISDWRQHWGQGDFPFIFVQLAGFDLNPENPEPDRWPWLREAQAKTLSLPNTGMATAADIGDGKDIHPKNKLDVGRRLALVARRLVYGEQIVDAGPLYESMKVEGDKIRISFHGKGLGLRIAAPPVLPSHTPLPIPEKLTGFTIAGADQKWQPADATIDGDTVVVSASSVPSPVAVRYAWQNLPACSLYNKEGLPAFPFRTDDWKPEKK
ncbi:MAG: sialate O-acetylesterase [Candidatus Methylacidiphilales bacterium]|nr:sialate O-acetylesterase [Candidatus Methylacidiphilales bacterium]